MAFPSIRGTPTHGNSGGNVTSYNVTLPATVEAGDLLFVFVSTDGDSETLGVTGFAEIAHVTSGAHTSGVFWKRAAGTEDGATVAASIGTSESAAWVAYCIQGAHASTDPEGAYGTTGSGTAIGGLVNTPDPLAPSWGTEDTLWIFADTWDGGHTATEGAWNPNGSLYFSQDAVSGSGGTGVAVHATQEAIASRGPSGAGTWSSNNIETGDNCNGHGVAIRPAAPPAPPASRPERVYRQVLAQ